MFEPIKIGPKFSIVGVPETSVDEVLDALRQTMIRGRKASVRRYVEHRQERGPERKQFKRPDHRRA